MINDGGGAFVEAVRNSVVSTTNYGIAIVGGHSSGIWRNQVVNDGRADDGRPVGPEYAVGLAVWDAGGSGDVRAVAADRNLVGWVHGSDLTRNDWWTPACDPATACDHNRSIRGGVTATDERRVRSAWWAAVEAAGHTIGPPAPDAAAGDPPARPAGSAWAEDQPVAGLVDDAGWEVSEDRHLLRRAEPAG